MLGYLSLMEVQSVLDRRLGKTAGWTVAIVSLMLSGFGIYLGRFLRLNSWYVITRPIALFKSLAGAFVNPGPHPHPVPVTLIFGVGLIVGYLAVRVVAAPINVEPVRGSAE